MPLYISYIILWCAAILCNNNIATYVPVTLYTWVATPKLD